MTLTSLPLCAVLALLLVWFGYLSWAIWRFHKKHSGGFDLRLKLTLLGLLCSVISVAALLALHISWISVSLSQRIGANGIRVIAVFLFWSALIGFAVSLGGQGKIRFVSLATCFVTGLWWFSLVMESAISMSGPNVRHPISYLIPDGYIGWVIVDYGVTGAPTLQIRDSTLQVKFPDSGIVQTQSNLESGWAQDKYFYYSITGQQRELKDTNWGGGGMIWAAAVGEDLDSKGRMKDVKEYFFVGTEDQYKHGPEAVDKYGEPEIGNQHR